MQGGKFHKYFISLVSCWKLAWRFHPVDNSCPNTNILVVQCLKSKIQNAPSEGASKKSINIDYSPKICASKQIKLLSLSFLQQTTRSPLTPIPLTYTPSDSQNPSPSRPTSPSSPISPTTPPYHTSPPSSPQTLPALGLIPVAKPDLSIYQLTSPRTRPFQA